MIRVTQTCDGCGKTRPLETASQSEHGGWREVDHGRHLCSGCINKALGEEARG